jgi:hypothetical protein
VITGAAMITGSLLAPSTLLLPVDDAERQDARCPAALQLLGYASAAQRAAGALVTGTTASAASAAAATSVGSTGID